MNKVINLLPRQVEIIQFLLKNQDYQPVKAISEHMKYSIKTIRNDLKIIEKSVANEGINMDKRPGIGVKLSLSDEEKMNLNLIVNSNKKNNFDELSTEARRIKILSDLLNDSSKNTSIQKLSEKYYISKTSIVNDLKSIEERVQIYNLKLERGQHGTKIIGNEVDIRKAMVSIIDELISFNEKLNNLVSADRIDNATLQELSKQFEEKSVKLVEKILMRTEENLNYKIGEPYYINLVTHILILIKRIRSGNGIFKCEDINRIKITDEKVYEASNKMGKLIESYFGITLPKEEVFFIYQYLISSGLGFSSLKIETEKLFQETNLEAKEIANEMIRLCSDILQVDLNIDKQLYKNLMIHLKPMLNRINYRILIKNPLAEEVKKEFHMVFGLLSLVMLIISEKFHLNYISKDEIAYLVVYLQAAIEKSMSQKRVIVVCSSGIGTSHLLKNRIKKAFSDWDIVDVVPLSSLESEVDLDNIDFVISTVKVGNISKPVAYVTALFSDIDVRNVTEILMKDALKEEDRSTFRVLKSLLDINYINVIGETKYKDKKIASLLFEKMVDKKYLVEDETEDIFVSEISMSEIFEVYLSHKVQSNNSCIGINVINKPKNESKIQVVIACQEDDSTIKDLIVELFQLFNNKDIIRKIGKCKTREQIFQIFF
jgi:activator of the mannose operon (transcriptional antiterminator)